MELVKGAWLTEKIKLERAVLLHSAQILESRRLEQCYFDGQNNTCSGPQNRGTQGMANP